MSEAARLFAGARRHAEAGRVAQAARLCRAVPEGDAAEGDALNLLGALADYARASDGDPDMLEAYRHGALAAAELHGGGVDRGSIAGQRRFAILRRV
ncbi:MAG: hypothetical protein ACLQJR_04550 [Stellaceae bacterium]